MYMTIEFASIYHFSEISVIVYSSFYISLYHFLQTSEQLHPRFSMINCEATEYMTSYRSKWRLCDAKEVVDDEHCMNKHS